MVKKPAGQTEKIRHLCSMEIRMVVAASENNYIGVDNQLPWHLPDDLKFFKRMTNGMPVIMGRNTWISLGRPLPGRLNVVISSSLKEVPEGVLVFESLQHALDYLEQQRNDMVSIIGGGQLYRSALHLADVVYLTRVHTILENGTASFPKLPAGEWQLTWEEPHAADEKHAYAFTFQKWEHSR